MPQPFEFDGHTYTFDKRGSEVIPIREDGAMPWSTYRTYTVQDGKALPAIHAYTPALPTVTECKQLITGDTRIMTTSVHRVIWAATAEQAAALRAAEDAAPVPAVA